MQLSRMLHKNLNFFEKNRHSLVLEKVDVLMEITADVVTFNQVTIYLFCTQNNILPFAY